MKSAYLTIDDSPSPDMPQKVDYLFRQQIPATFFCRGDFMELYPEYVIDAIHKGFIIANHSYSHPHFSDIDAEAAYQEISRTDEIIDRLYVQSGQKRPVKWFRFPFGDKGDGRYGKVLDPLTDAKGIDRKNIIQAILLGLGYQLPNIPEITYKYYQDYQLSTDADWHWTYDTMEWSLLLERPLRGLASLEDFIARMSEKAPKDVRGRAAASEKRWFQSDSHEIILLHDHTETTHIFEEILEAYKDKGVHFLPFTKLYSA